MEEKIFMWIFVSIIILVLFIRLILQIMLELKIRKIFKMLENFYDEQEKKYKEYFHILVSGI